MYAQQAIYKTKELGQSAVNMAVCTRRKFDRRTGKEKKCSAMAKRRWDAGTDVTEYDDPATMESPSDEDDWVTTPVKRCLKRQVDPGRVSKDYSVVCTCIV